ncbi:hypothetical protein [Nocardia sp. NPDC050413]|uniref:hypothetical protein n=1 Tax=Nocardia sp. NPDC050413 TaxID=3155784 RepID=UPI0033E57A41
MLKISLPQVEQWQVWLLNDWATTIATANTGFDYQLGRSVNHFQDLHGSWQGAAADAAYSKMDEEKNQDQRLSTQVSELVTELRTGATGLTSERSSLLGKVADAQDLPFTVNGQAVKFSVTANWTVLADYTSITGLTADMVKEIQTETTSRQGQINTAYFSFANAAEAFTTAISTHATEIRSCGNVLGSGIDIGSFTESGVMGALGIPGLLSGAASGAPTPAEAAMLLNQGKEVRFTMPDGSTKTITPNADGTLTVAQSVTGADGSTTITASTNGGPPTTTVMTPRPDGSGIIDTTVTDPNGVVQRSRTIPTAQGRNETYAVNADGSIGAKLAESYRAEDGGVVTDSYKDGVIDRQWKGPDGFTANERYVIAPDGQQVLVGTSNSTQMSSELKPDGTIHTTFPDGRTAVTTQFVDGKVLTEFSDKSVLAYDPSTAAEGVAKQSPWDVVKSWSGGHVNGFIDSTVGTVQTHPWETVAGMGASAASEGAGRSSVTMAEKAAELSGIAAQKQITAFNMLDAGTPGAGRAAIEGLDASADAASKAGAASAAGTAAKVLGWPATIGVNSYINYQDWQNGKPADEAVANAVGGTVGGMGGAWLGGAAGAAICAPTVIATPLCAAGGAALGGFLGGSAGAYVAEQPFK